MNQEILTSDLTILSISLIIILSILGVKFSAKVNTPSLLILIFIGMLIGSEGLDIADINNPQIAHFIGMIGLVLILFDGGMKTNWKSIRPVVKPAISLATLGVFITSLIVGILAKILFQFSWPEALLIGALMGSTDAAAVFSMLQGKNLKEHISKTLEAESGSNDPMAVFLTITFINLVSGESSGLWGAIGLFIWQMGGGLLIGLFIGWIGHKSLATIRIPSSGLYPLSAVAFALLSYSTASLLNASSLLAVYVAALVIGNLPLKHKDSLLQFNQGLSWIANFAIFIMLGLFVSPSNLFQISTIINGLLISMVLMFIARPSAVFLSVMGMKINLKEKLFLSWAGLRGAVPIVLAIYPMLHNLEHSDLYFHIVFFVVLTSTLIQGPTITPVAEKVGVTKEKEH